MKRLATAMLSLSWMAVFAFLSGFALLAAEDGAEAAVATFRLPVAPQAIEAIAGLPGLAGLCLGAAVVAALFATVLVSSALNMEKDLRQGALIADMAFGGAFGLSGLVFLAFFMQPANGPAAAIAVLATMLVISFLAMRSAMTAGERVEASPVPARRMALDAAANINVVRFPIERAAAAGEGR